MLMTGLPSQRSASSAGAGQVGAELHQAFDRRVVDLPEGVDDLLVRQMAIGVGAFALQVVVLDDLVAELAEDALHLGLDGLVVRLDDGDFLLDAVQLQRFAHAVDRRRDADVAPGAVLHATAQILDRRQGPAPDRQRRDAEHQIVRIAGHHPLHRAVEPGVDQRDAAVETVVVGGRNVLDMHTAEMVGDAGRTHVVVFGLHDRVGGRRRHPHFRAVSEVVDHLPILPGQR